MIENNMLDIDNIRSKFPELRDFSADDIVDFVHARAPEINRNELSRKMNYEPTKIGRLFKAGSQQIETLVPHMVTGVTKLSEMREKIGNKSYTRPQQRQELLDWASEFKTKTQISNEEAKKWSSQIGGAFGSMAKFAGLSLTGAGLAGMGVEIFGQSYQDISKSNPEWSEEKRSWYSMARALPEALLERWGTTQLLNPLLNAGKMSLKQGLTQGSFWGMAKQGIKSYVIEGTQEASQQVAGNSIDMLYKLDRGLFDGVVESFILGGLVAAPLGLVAGFNNEAFKAKFQEPLRAIGMSEGDIKDLRDTMTKVMTKQMDANPEALKEATDMILKANPMGIKKSTKDFAKLISGVAPTIEEAQEILDNTTERQQEEMVNNYKLKDKELYPDGDINIESDAFRNVFEGSKVIDEQGNPLMVYHGTGEIFEEFNTEGGEFKTKGTGAYFSSSSKIAETYTIGDNPNIVPAYLNLQAPLEIDFNGQNWASGFAKDTFVLKDGVKTPLSEVMGEGNLKEYSTDDLVKYARSVGEYDGVVIKNVLDTGGKFVKGTGLGTESNVYVAFDKSSIIRSESYFKKEIQQKNKVDDVAPTIEEAQEILDNTTERQQEEIVRQVKVKETEKQSAIVEEAKLFHGTKKGNKAKILKDGFTLNSVKRNYTYSELGETAMYFTKDSNSGWLSPEAAEKMRAVPYDEVVEVSAEGLNLKEIKNPEDWAAFEKELGIEEGGMKDLDVDEADHETLKKKSSDIIQKIKDSGYDGVDLQYTDMEARGHEVPAGEQVAVYNLDKLNVNLSKQKAKPLTGIETTEGDKVSGLAKEALKYDSAEEFKQSLYDREYDYFNKETNDIDYKLYYKTILAKNFIEDFYPNFKDNPILAQEVSDELGIVYSKELSSWVKSPNLSEFFKDKQYGNIDILEKVSIEKIYNEAHAQTKSVAKDTGGDKVSGLAKRMAKNLKEKYGIDISEDDMIKYQSITNEEQIDKAMKIYNDDPARANRIALGLEKPPEGILPTTFYVIAEKMAIKNKDVDMLQMLATQSSIASDASKMGQTIQMLSQIEENSPLKSIQRVVKARKANFEKSSKKSLKEAIKTEKVKLTNEIDEAYDSLDAGIDSFIKELEC